MTVQRSGVEFVGIGYREYMDMLRNVNRAQREAFGTASQKSMGDFDKKTKAAGGAAQQLTKKLVGLTGGAGQTVAAMAAAATGIGVLIAAALGAIDALGKLTQKFLEFVRASTEVAARNETLRVSLEQVGKVAGYTSTQIASAVEQVKAKGITTKAAEQALLKLAQAEIEWTHASNLARIAQDAAVIGNINSSEAFERMIHGLQVGNKLILKNIGLNVNFQLAYRKYANQIGKSVLDLTEQERAQARVNEVLAAGEKIYGTYEAAMKTAGKQANSLIRYIEETQANLGTLTLPLKVISVTLKTDFWRGMQLATAGMTSWGIVIDKIVRRLLNMRPASEGLFDTIGRLIHESARGFVMFSEVVVSAIRAAALSLELFVTRGAGALSRFVRGDFVGAAEAIKGIGKDIGQTFKTTFVEQFEAIDKANREAMPQLFQSWDELKEKMDEDLSLPTDNIADQINALNDLKAEYEAQAQALERVEQIQRQYNDALADAAKDYAKKVAEAAKKEAKEREKIEKRTLERLEDLEEDYAERRADIIRDFNKERVREQKNAQDELERNRKRYELDRLQSLRRFQLSERRLRAEGDVLALMELRENYELQKKEAKENFDFGQDEAKRQAMDEQRQQQEDLDERLQELERDIRKRRQEIQEGYQEELAELEASNAERRAEMAAAYQEQLNDLRVSRDRQLQELGRSLEREGTITKEGMDRIAEEMSKVFGDEGIGIALVEGWAQRSQEAVSEAGREILLIIKRIDNAIATLEEGGEIDMADITRPSSRPASRGRWGGWASRTGMAQGGVGVVTGPRLFEVEPGRKELVAFVPMGRYGGGGGGNIDVNVAGGVDVRGADQASPMVVEAAVTMMMNEIGAAVKRGRFT